MKLHYKIGIITYDFQETINEWIAPEFRKEAQSIIYHILNSHNYKLQSLIIEWVIYIERKKGNLICMHLDLMKNELVKQGIMKKGGNFGLEID